MKDIIFDNLPSLNSKLAKNKFLKVCYSMPAYMPEACKSFIKMIQLCLDNIIYEIRIIVRACFAAWQRTIVLIGFDHSFCLQTVCKEKIWAKTICSKTDTLLVIVVIIDMRNDEFIT